MRLIDANAMREDWLENGENEYVYDTNAVLESIDAQPTVDAVEVVRCKDCKHYKPRSQSVHWEHTVLCCARSANLKFPPEGFCSYGERKDNGL